MFERFTDRARRVVVLAQEEARTLNHGYIGTEHLLLGLIGEGEGVAAKALEALGISLEGTRRQVEEVIGVGTTEPTEHMPFTPPAKKVLELSLREALELGHNYIGTEHILLGIIREQGGVAAQVLQREGAEIDRVRQQVVRLLSGYTGAAADVARAPTQEVELRSSEPSVGPDPGSWPLCPRCRSPLAETARYRVLDVPSEEEGAETLAVPFGYCSKCGVWLGTVA